MFPRYCVDSITSFLNLWFREWFSISDIERMRVDEGDDVFGFVFLHQRVVWNCGGGVLWRKWLGMPCMYRNFKLVSCIGAVGCGHMNVLSVGKQESLPTLTAVSENEYPLSEEDRCMEPLDPGPCQYYQVCSLFSICSSVIHTNLPSLLCRYIWQVA